MYYRCYGKQTLYFLEMAVVFLKGPLFTLFIGGSGMAALHTGTRGIYMVLLTM